MCFFTNDPTLPDKIKQIKDRIKHQSMQSKLKKIFPEHNAASSQTRNEKGYATHIGHIKSALDVFDMADVNKIINNEFINSFSNVPLWE